MSAHLAGPYRLSILNGQTDSAALSSLLSLGQLKTLLGSATMASITCVSAALTGVVTAQVVVTEGGSTWSTLQQAAADIAVAALKTVLVQNLGFRDIRIHSTLAEGAQRDFDLTFQLAVTT